MILTPDERRALLGLLSLLVLGQGVALLRDERKARPDRELSAWLTRAQAARAESLGAEAGLANVQQETTLATQAGGRPIAAGRVDETGEDALDGAVAESTASPPGARALESVPIESASSIPAGVAATGRVAINRASARDLEALPGIGPSLAKRIVEEREKAGPFRSPRDLLRVKGIGPKKQAAIQDRIDWSL
jgi:competence ComEA-like helix-hairpin-helix protein